NVDVDVKERRRIVGNLPDAPLDGWSAQRPVVRTEVSLDLPKAGFVQQIQAMNELAFEQEVAGDEKTGQRPGRRRAIPQRDARPDRLHTSWYPTPRTVLKRGLPEIPSSFARRRLMYTSSRLVSTS